MTVLRSLALSLMLLAAVLSAAAQAMSPPFAACLDAEDPPFSDERTPERGIDVEVAQAIAGQLGRMFRPVWVQVPNRGGLGKALRQTLVAGQCDAYLGIPQGPDMARELAERKLLASGPYLRLGYVLLAPAGSVPPGAATLRGARKIGAVSATPADLYLHRKQLPRAPYAGNAALLAALRAGEIDLALAWSSALAGDAAQGLVQGTQPLDDAELYTGVTVATRAADGELSRQIATAIEQLHSEGRFDAIAKRHGLPRIARP